MIFGSELPDCEKKRNGGGGRLKWLQWGVPFHELGESLAALALGITPEAVDRFDKQFEIDHADDDAEPGDDPRCPVHFQHQFAMMIEREFITKMLGFSWFEYEKIVDKPWLDGRGGEAKAREKVSGKNLARSPKKGNFKKCS